MKIFPAEHVSSLRTFLMGGSSMARKLNLVLEKLNHIRFISYVERKVIFGLSLEEQIYVLLKNILVLIILTELWDGHLNMLDQLKVK
jgi:hypothetical protein